jgi:hypothetical protein
MSVADKGDPCDEQMQGASACTPNKASIVMCGDGEFIKDQDCKKGEECNPGGATRCEKPSVESG